METKAKLSAEWRRELTGRDLERYTDIKSDFIQSANIFKQVRKAFGLSQVDAARLLDTTQANVSKIENRSETDFSYLGRLVNAAGGQVSFTITAPGGKKLIID